MIYRYYSFINWLCHNNWLKTNNNITEQKVSVILNFFLLPNRLKLEGSLLILHF